MSADERPLRLTRRQSLFLAITSGLLVIGNGWKEGFGDPLSTAPRKPSGMQTAEDAWKRIHAWLDAHAPKIRKSLNRPATDEQMAAAEKAFGGPLPDDFRALYGTHDGMDTGPSLVSLFHGMEFLPLKKVIRELDDQNQPVDQLTPVRSADPGINTRHMYNSKWIPFAQTGDTLLCIDLDPTPAGTGGQVIFRDHSDNTVLKLAPSLPAFLLGFAADLEEGRYFLDPEAKAEGEEFLDCVREIDVVNWHLSPKWKHHARSAKR